MIKTAPRARHSLDCHFYILVDRIPVPEPDGSKWSHWCDRFEDRVVAKATITDDEGRQSEVSTVFLAVDQAFGAGVPLLFETLVLGGLRDDGGALCSTWDEAVAQHERVVATLTKGPVSSTLGSQEG